MKKVKVFSLSLLTLFLMFFMLISIGGVGVSAYTYRPGKLGHDFSPYKDDIVFCSMVDGGSDYLDAPNLMKRWHENVVLVHLKDIRATGYFQFNLTIDFSPEIEEGIRDVSTGDYCGSFIITEYGLDGMYWNPWLEIWQLDYPVGTAADWFNHISQFDYSGLGYGLARCEIYLSDNYEFGLIIVEEPLRENEELKFKFAYGSTSGDWEYFEPELGSRLENWYNDGDDIIEELESYYGEDFDGYLYWNFEENYWQINYYNYNKSEFDNNKEVDMVTDLLDTLAEIGAGIGDLFGRIVESVGQFFYTPGTGDTPGSFTIIGILTIAAVVVSLSMWVLRLILRLFKLRG